MNAISDKTQKIQWPLDPDYAMLGIVMFFVWPWGLAELLFARPRRKEKSLQARTLTNSILMSSAKYIGGHPLLPTSCSVVLGLTQDKFNIFTIDKEFCISIFSTISLLDIVSTGTGRPKTAQEIYDEDNRRTIDVIEGSPFLHMVFKMGDEKYSMSFEKFDESAPQEWHNQIVHLKYLLTHEKQRP